jgi:hypothetical protein
MGQHDFISQTYALVLMHFSDFWNVLGAGVNESTAMTYTNRRISAEEQRLYNHFLTFVQSETPDQLIGRVRQLLIEGLSYPDASILHDLDMLLMDADSEQNFRFVLNRCIHILSNRWQGRPQVQSWIPELVNLLESSPTLPITNHTRARSIKRLRELVRQFLETEQHLSLKRLATVMSQDPEHTASQPLGQLMRRYPYLYAHCLIPEGASHEDQQSVRNLQEEAQYRFEIDLSRYVTYQVRKSELLQSASDTTVGRILYPVKNPTLLTEAEVCESLRHFVGKVDGRSTHRELANRFLDHTQYTTTFKGFKDDLYEYLVGAVEPEYGRRQFNKLLYLQLQTTLPELNYQPMNELMLMRLCSQIFSFLVVESQQQPRHFVFVDLIANLGPMMTTSLLLRLLLICRKIKPYLEKRFSILFSHYESHTQSTVEWLVAAMENLNIALSTNFGNMNVAFVNRI